MGVLKFMPPLPQPLKFRTLYAVSRQGSSMTLVRGVHRGRKLAVTCLWQGPDPADCPSPILQQVRAQLLAGQAAVVTGIPARESLCRHLETPFPSVRKAMKVFPGLLDVEIPFALEQCSSTFTGIRRQEHRVIALGVAATLQGVLQAEELLRSAGLAPIVVDQEAVAAWEQSHLEQPAGSNATRITCLASEQETLLVLGSDESFSASVSFPIGTAHLEQPDPQQAAQARTRWTSSASRFLEAWQRDLSQDLSWAWACPADVADQELNELLQALPVSPREILRIDDPETFPARAYLRRAARPTAWSINLLQGSLEPTAVQARRNRSLRTAAATILAAGLMLAAAGITARLTAARPLLETEQRISRLARDLSGMPPVHGQEVLVVERALDRKAGIEKPLHEALRQDRAESLRRLLLAARETGIQLSTLEITGKSLAARGTTSDWNRGDLFRQTVESLGYTARLDRQPAGADELVHFTLEGTSR